MLTPTTHLKKVAEADFPSRYGHFRILGFEWNANGETEDSAVLVMGDVTQGPPPLVRIHSQCLTGDVFGSIKCDCGPQLHRAMELIETEGRGAIVYQQQEGRGIGIINKIRAYALQDEGADTVEANERLGLGVDLREYDQCVEILRDLGLKKVKVLSNNPEKIQAMRDGGLEVTERIPIEFKPSKNTLKYLTTKKLQMGHLLHLVS